MPSCPRTLTASLLLACTHPVLASMPVAGPAETPLSGAVMLESDPLVDAEVTLFRSGSLRREGAIALATTTTDENGAFELTYQTVPGDEGILYLIADRDHQRVATVLGSDGVPEQVVLNELTTVATAYVMNQFLDGSIIGGNAVGVGNAASVFRNLVDLETGEVAEVLATFPNGESTDALRTFNTLGNLLAAASSPKRFMVASELATPPCGPAPADLLELAVTLARHPGTAPQGLFDLSETNVLYQPALQSATEDGDGGTFVTWTLMLRYGGGPEFKLDGPGFVAVDELGTIWIANNFEYAARPTTPVCSGTHLIRLAPNGELFGASPYSGGGLSGAGWGLGFDPGNRVWVGNFGFKGNGADCPDWSSNSVSLFTSDGEALSPGPGDNPDCDPDQGGFCAGGIDAPQGVASDSTGTIWIANLCAGSMTRFPAGDPLQAAGFSLVPEDVEGESAPFGVAIDGRNRAWVTDNGASTMYCIQSDDTYEEVVPSYAIDFKRPLGNAVDSLGNAWVADSGIIPISDGGNCTGRSVELSGTESRYGELVPNDRFAGIMRVTPDGRLQDRYTGGGLSIPWGVAIDGDDHVWVADFNGRRVSQFCGANEAHWPCGLGVGDPISPPEGYRSNALARNVALAIDQSGNVWLSNNFLIDCFGERDANPGGRTMVQFIGVASPVAPPLIGPPRRPDAAPTPSCPADFDGNGRVDGADLTRLLSAWGSSDGWHNLAGDSTVGGADLTALLESWGRCDRSD